MLKTATQTSRFLLLTSLALLPVAPGCGAEAGGIASTDTGNPPFIDVQSVSITASGENVLVVGKPGAASAGAEVEITNVLTAEKASTTAQGDGSFTATLAGSIGDGYRIVATRDGKDASATVPGDGAAGGMTGALDLTGKTFLLQMAAGFAPVPNTVIGITFGENGQLGFTTGCNGHGGEYTICETDKLCVDQLMSTLIGCPQPLAEQESWLADFFTSKPTLTQDGDTLTVASDDATLEFLDEAVANPDRDLVGPTWTVDTLISGGAAMSVMGAFAPTLRFRDDGTLEANGGCNGGGGGYKVQGASIEFSDISFTERGCPDQDAARTEAQFYSVLGAGATFEIKQNRLTVMNGDVGFSATTE